jgi:hypothetical protein
MNKKHLIYLGIGMVLIVGYLMFVNAEQTSSWCYQETANVSTACGGLDNGGYITPGGAYDYMLYDENWISGVVVSYYYFNYSKPTNSESSSLLQVKNKLGGTSEILNLSILSSCWNYNSTTLIFKADLLGEPQDQTNWSCYDGNWKIINEGSLYTDMIYEEGIYWNITTGEPDVVLPSLHISLTGTNNHLKLSGTNSRLNIRNQT